MRTRFLLPALALFAASAAIPAELPSIDKPPAGTVADLSADVALILAIEDYAALPDVAGAVANARAWSEYLRARGVGIVKVMLNGDVTRESLLGTSGITGLRAWYAASCAAAGGSGWCSSGTAHRGPDRARWSGGTLSAPVKA